jgi:hypothetical protein
MLLRAGDQIARSILNRRAGNYPCLGDTWAG